MNLIFSLCLVVATVSLFLAGLILRLNSRNVLNRMLALVTLSYVFWVFWSGVACAAVDSESFWFALRLALVGFLACGFLSNWVTFFYAGVRGFPAWVILSPLLLLTLVEAFQACTGVWIFSGYHAGAWGNVVTLAADSAWVKLDEFKGLSTFVLDIVLFVIALKRSPTRRFRTIVIQVLVVSVFVNIAGIVARTLIWQVGGYPEMSVLFGFLHVLNMFYLISRFQHLMDQQFTLSGPLFRSVDELLLLLDSQGRIVHCTTRMAGLLAPAGDELTGQKLTSVLTGWPGLAEAYQTLRKRPSAEILLEGRVGAGRFTLTLTPQHDQYSDLAGILAQLTPAGSLDEAVQRYGLTSRERDVAEALVEGLETKEIAERLFVSPLTVKTHLQNLFRKTEAANRTELSRVLVGGQGRKPD